MQDESWHFQATRLIINHLQASWSIESNSRLEAVLSPTLDVTVTGQSRVPGGLPGDAPWELKGAENGGGIIESGAFRLGEGRQRLHLDTLQELIVNIR